MTTSFPERLRNARFEQDAPKRVDYAAAWEMRSRGVEKGSQAEIDLLAIIYAIGAGNLVPERCYRHGVDRNHPRDELLEDRGIKHLHLGGADSDIVLYLVEYEEFVLLLEIGTHRDLETEPPGSILASLHHNCLRRADAQAAGDRAKRIANKAAIFFKGLLPRRPRD
jgi:hypothetical protein